MSDGSGKLNDREIWLQILAVVFSLLMVTSTVAVSGVGAVAAQSPATFSTGEEVETSQLNAADTCTLVAEDESIQDAVDDAEPGATLCVESGTFDEPVVIGVAGLTITAANSTLPVLSGDAASAVTIDAAGVTVESLELVGWETGIELTENAADATVSNTELLDVGYGVRLKEGGDFGQLQLTDSTFNNDETGSKAVEIDPSGAAMFNEITVVDNEFSSGSDTISLRGSGITADSITVSDNQISGGNGLYLYGVYTVGETVTITGNTLSNAAYGLYVYPYNSTFETVNISENVLTASEDVSPYSIIFESDDQTRVETLSMNDNAVLSVNGNGIGVYSWETSFGEIEISDNTVDVGSYGLYLWLDYTPAVADSVVISENDVTAADGEAISLEMFDLDPPDVFEITSNRLTDSESGIGISGDEPPSVLTVRENEFVGNDVGLDYGVSTGTVNAVENWWGDESGPSGAVDDPVTDRTAEGDGDSVTENVQFDPWTTTEPETGDDPDSDAAFFTVKIDSTNSPIELEETLSVTVIVENIGEQEGTQTVELEDFGGTVVDSAEQTLGADDSEQLILVWETGADDGATGEITVRSDDETSTETATVLTGETIEVNTCTVIDTPGDYALTGDLTGSDTCLEITADGVSLNGNGHTIGGVDVSDDGIQYGILVNGADDVTVENVTLSGWDIGLSYREASDGQVSNVVSENGGTGADFGDAHDNEVSELTVQHNQFRGLIVGPLTSSKATGNTFTNVIAIDNERSGGGFNPGAVELGWGASGNEFHGLTSSESVAGVRTAAGSSSNSFTDVVANDNSRYGLDLETRNGDTFDGVDVAGNGRHGIRLGQSRGNELTNVTATNNDGTAIFLVGDLSGGTATSNNVFESVNMTDNDGSGFQLSNADHNELRNLEFVNNTGSAINLPSRSIGNTVTDAIATEMSGNIFYIGPDTNDGNSFENIEIVDSQGGMTILGEETTVTGLTVSDGSGTALMVSTGMVSAVQAGGSENTLTDIHVENFVGTGIRVGGEAMNNELSGITIDELEGTGLSLQSGTNNTVSEATLTATDVGISLGDARENRLESITLGDTTLSGYGSDVRLKATDEPTQLPAGVEPTGHYVEITGTSESAELEYLEISYDSTDLDDIAETSLRVWRYDGGWHSPAMEPFISGYDTDETYVFAYGVTDFSTFGVFGETDPEPFETGDLEGTVTENGSGESLEGVRLVVFDSAGFGAITDTAVDGSYDLSLPAGTYELEASYDGYLPTTISEIKVLEDGTTTKDVTLEPEPEPGTLSGVVTDDETGNGINNAALVATATESGAEWTATTTFSGEYDLELPPGAYDLEVDAQGFEPTVLEDVTISEAETTTADAQLEQTEYAEFTVRPDEPVVDETVTFDASESTLPYGDIEGYRWDFTGDGQSDLTTTDPVLTHNYTAAGDYEVRLDVLSDFGYSESATQTVTVSEQPETDIVLYGSSVDSTTVEDGDTVTVTGNLFNDGSLEGSKTVELTVDGETVATDSVTVEGGAINAVELNWDASLPEGQETATVDLRLNNLSVDTVTVENLYSDIQVIAASVSENEVVAGETFSTIGSIYQGGTIDGSEDITLNATNDETGTVTELGVREGVSLSPGFYHLGAINITTTIEEAGTYTLDLGGQQAGTLEVLPAESDIQVIAATTSEDEIVAGEEFYTIGSIYQAGTIDGPEDIALNATNDETDETIPLGVAEDRSLAPGFYHLGAVNISATITEAGNYTLELGDRTAGTIEVEPAVSDIQVIAATASEDSIVAGDEFHTVGSVYQAGTISGPEDIVLNATNTGTAETIELGVAEDRSLAPGFYHLGAVNISATITEAGTYTLELGDRTAGTIEVEPAESDIQVIAATASEDTIVAGDEFHTVGSIYQAGTIDGPEDITLNATNVETDETIELGVAEDRSLAPGFYHLGAVNLTATITEAGNYTLELGDRTAGTIEVEPAVSDIQVIAATASEDTIVAGDEFHTIGSVYQAGTIDGPQNIVLNATNDETGDVIELGVNEGRMLSPGYYHLGAINITATIDQPGTYTVELGERTAGTIEVEPAVSNIQVIAASPSEMNVTTGEEFSVVGSIYQAGNIDGNENIVLNATNHETGNVTELGVAEDVTLAPGFYHLGAINITSSIDKPGRYDLTLGDRDAGTVGVDESPSDIQVIAASLSEIEVLEGEELYVIGSIYQNGTANGNTFSEDIELRATDQDGNEQLVGVQEDVELQSGFYHLGAVNISFAIDEPGVYDLTLGEQAAGQLEVIEAKSDIQVIAATASEDEIVAGDEFYTIGSLYQGGTIDGPEDITLTATNDETAEVIELGVNEGRTLAPGYYHLGAINITATIDQPGTYTVELGGTTAGTIEILPAESDIQVIAASTSEDEIVAGDEFYTIGSLYQGGTIDGPEDIALTATNDESDETIELDLDTDRTLTPGFYHLGAINITTTIETPGTYSLKLGGTAAGTIEVLPAESDIQVIAASTSEDEIVADEVFYTIGSLYQAGTINGPEDIILNATNDETDDVIELGVDEGRMLAPGYYHLGAINITATIDQPGTYTLDLGGQIAGTLEVLPAESEIQVIAASASKDTVAEGEPFFTIGSLYQAGTIDGPENIALTATNDETDETIELGMAEDRTLTPGFYHLGSINLTAAFEQGDAGTYSLELGNRNAGSITVTEPTVDPTITDVAGHSSGPDPDTGEPLVYASTEATVNIDVESDRLLEEVTLLVDSLETSYRVTAPASHESGDRWTVAVPIDDIPDDGRYALSVVAVDDFENAALTQADETLVIDREGPAMSVSFEELDSSGATVVIESTDALATLPDVDTTLIEPDGSTSPITIEDLESNSHNTVYTGSVDFTESGNYSVTVTGTDRAGNDGSDSSSVAVNTGFMLDHGEIVIDDTGTSIAFEVADDADTAMKTQELFVALSENANNANLDGGALGVGFITAELDSFLDYHLDQGTIEGAAISMAIDETQLGAGVDATDVEIQYHDEAAGEWTPVDSTVTTVGGDPFVTATVTHFSTYGAVVPDNEPPEITSISPVDGEQFGADTNETTIEFSYEDALSGINVSTIALEVDGTPVTGAQSTSTETTYDLAVDAGETYTVTLFVSDMAGNEANAETRFVVGTDSDSSDSGGSSGGSSGGASTPDSGTNEDADEEIEAEADDSGADLADDDTDDEPATDTAVEDDTPPADSAVEDTVPGFGAGLAALAVILCALLIARRTEED